MKKIGPEDITYCLTQCEQKRCKRNLKYWEPPTNYCSMAMFDKKNDDILHNDCEDKWLELEEEVKE